MEDKYDVIILGTGIKEYIIMGLLLKFPRIRKIKLKLEEIKIYQLNKNEFFGEDCPSLNLTKLWSNFNKGENPPEAYGEDKDWNIDLIPKIMMTNSPITKILTLTDVYHYIEWKNIEEAFVYQYDKGGMFSSARGRIYKVPSSQDDIVNSNLMGMFEKNRCKKFYNFVRNYNGNNSNGEINVNLPFNDVVQQFGLELNTIDFIGHAVALYSNNSFYHDKTKSVIKKINFYLNCLESKNKNIYYTTPFIYPIWGLQKIYKNYERQFYLSDFQYEKNCDVEDILYDEDNKFKGIKTSKGKYIYGSILISEPSYMTKFNKVEEKNRVIRRICLMNHPIPDIGECDSCQIIIPQTQTGKKNDIFILQLGYGHCVCKKGYYVVVISTFDDKTDINRQLAPAMEIIGSTLECLDKVYTCYEPIDKTFNDCIYISNSFMPHSHFENDYDDIIDEFQKITDTQLEFESAPKNPVDPVDKYNHNYNA